MIIFLIKKIEYLLFLLNTIKITGNNEEIVNRVTQCLTSLIAKSVFCKTTLGWILRKGKTAKFSLAFLYSFARVIVDHPTAT